MNQYIRTNKHKDKNFTYNEKNEHTCKRFTKDRVVQQLEEIFFKFIFRSCMFTSVEVDVVFEPWWLIKQQNPMDFG